MSSMRASILFFANKPKKVQKKKDNKRYPLM